MSAFGSRNSRGDAPTSKPSIRTAFRSPPTIEPSISPRSRRASSISAAAEDAPVAGRERLRDRRGRPQDVDDDSERRRGVLGRREGDGDVHDHRYANCDVATCYRHPDRETGLSCSECGRPICTDCVTFAPVGLRCPDHAGTAARSTPRAVRSVQRPLARRGFVISGNAIVTKILVAANVAIYLVTVAQGNGLNNPGGSLFFKWVLYGPAVDHGDWWRLITSAFLHASVIHIAFNMLALWWLGAPVEMALGRVRYVALYFVSGLAGAAGALDRRTRWRSRSARPARSSACSAPG